MLIHAVVETGSDNFDLWVSVEQVLDAALARDQIDKDDVFFGHAVVHQLLHAHIH